MEIWIHEQRTPDLGFWDFHLMQGSCTQLAGALNRPASTAENSSHHGYLFESGE